VAEVMEEGIGTEEVLRALEEERENCCQEHYVWSSPLFFDSSGTLLA